jgi:uncharacterized iron-regulated protein
MSLNKWKIESVVLVALACFALGPWWFIATKDSRLAKKQYNQLVRYAQRQAVEIAVIEQASKLKNYEKQIEDNKKATEQVGPVLPENQVVDPVYIK